MINYSNNYNSMVDLVGSLLAAAVISYFTYNGFQDSETGEIRNVAALEFTIILHVGSYLLGYLLLQVRNDYLKAPNWVYIAVLGSIFCSASYRLPTHDSDLISSLILAPVFSIIALIIMCVVRILYGIGKRKPLGIDDGI